MQFEDANAMFRTAMEGDVLAVAVHDEWVVIGIKTDEGAAMIHIPPFVARDTALNLLRSADMSDGTGNN